MPSVQALILIAAFAATPDAPCAGPLTRDAVVACAVANSPALRADREHVAAARGDADAARVVLPQNPNVAVTIAHRSNSAGAQALNVSGTLSQPLEIGGQRRQRKKVAGARIESGERQAEATEREVVADALLAYYDVLASREELAVIEQAQTTSRRLAAVAEGRAGSGLASPVDADLAAADAAVLQERQALARGRMASAEARLASALGLDPSAPLPAVHGELAPLDGPALGTALREAEKRPELRALEADRRAEAAHVRLLKRGRAPSPTLSFFVQQDGLDEKVIGGGVAFPIPLPAPLGRTNRGRIEAANARVREAEERTAAVRREVDLEVVVAHHTLTASREASAAYPPEARARARQTLEDLATEIEAGRVPVRDALLTQQAFLDLLLRGVESRHALCRASVAMALAAGTPFPGGAS